MCVLCSVRVCVCVSFTRVYGVTETTDMLKTAGVRACLVLRRRF